MWLSQKINVREYSIQREREEWSDAYQYSITALFERCFQKSISSIDSLNGCHILFLRYCLYTTVVRVSQFVIHVFHSDSIGHPEMSLETPDYHGVCVSWIILVKLGPPTAIALSSRSLLWQSILNKLNISLRHK